MRQEDATQKRGMAFLLEPIDAASLVFFRIAFGLILAYDFLRLLSTGQVRTEYVEAVFHFTYYGFDWVRPWPGNGMYFEFYALIIISLFVALGLFYRLSAILLTLGLTHIFLIEATRFQNHSYLICMLSFLMIFMPLNRRFALDVRRRHRLSDPTVPRWSLWVTRFMIGMPYFYGGLAKLNWDWLSGMSLKWQLFLADYEWRMITDSMTAIHMFSWGGLFFDVLVVPGLMWRRTRPWAFLAACFFHAVNTRLFNIDIFPAFMVIASTMFFEPDWPRRLMARLRGVTCEAAKGTANVRGALTRKRRVGLSLLGFFVALQLLLPFRGVLYPGDRGWTREGFYFSWTMKLNVYMSGHTVYFVQDRQTQETLRVDQINFLTPLQMSRLASHPTRLLMVAHDLATWYRRTTGHDASVYIHNELSMNGRYLQLSIDPEVDLAAQRRSWKPSPWIRPLEAPLFPQLPLPLPERPAQEGEVWSRIHMHWHNIPGSGRGLVTLPGQPTRFYACPSLIPGGGS